MSITREQIATLIKDQDQTLSESEILSSLSSQISALEPTLSIEDIQRLLDDIHSYPEFTKGAVN